MAFTVSLMLPTSEQVVGAYLIVAPWTLQIFVFNCSLSQRIDKTPASLLVTNLFPLNVVRHFQKALNLQENPFTNFRKILRRSGFSDPVFPPLHLLSLSLSHHRQIHRWPQRSSRAVYAQGVYGGFCSQLFDIDSPSRFPVI